MTPEQAVQIVDALHKIFYILCFMAGTLTFISAQGRGK